MERNLKPGAGKPHSKDLEKFAVDLAVSAVNSSGRALDIDTGDVDPSPTALDLPAVHEPATCSHHRYVCVMCGTPLGRNPT
jgi:hypothetical protein